MKDEKKNNKSDFGKGFIYNLFLFTKHIDDYRQNRKGEYSKQDLFTFSMGARDHLSELVIPKKLEGTRIARLASELQNLCFSDDAMFKKFTESDFELVNKTINKIGVLLDEY